MDPISQEQIKAVEAVELDAEATPEATQEGEADQEGPQEGPGPQRGERAPREGEARASEGRGPRDSLGYSWERQTRECIELCTGGFGAVAATADLLDAPASLTDAEVQELGEVWGNLLRHFMEIKEGQKKGDMIRAYGETAIIARRKIQEIDEQEAPTDG